MQLCLASQGSTRWHSALIKEIFVVYTVPVEPPASPIDPSDLISRDNAALYMERTHPEASFWLSETQLMRIHCLKAAFNFT